MRAANSWLGPDGQCAPVAGSSDVSCEKGLHGPVAADPQGDSYVQQLTCEEDRPISRYLLNRAKAGLRCGVTAFLAGRGGNYSRTRALAVNSASRSLCRTGAMPPMT